MFMKSSKNKSSGMCQFCMATKIIIGVIAVLSSLAALIGVYKAHFLTTGPTFGTLNDSASLIALALNLFLVKKMASCCPCQCDMKK
jgi:hypothetical protein